jgi:hypothetical protein
LECKLCGEIENTDHIFLKCALASFSWNVNRDFFDWDSTRDNMNDIHCKLVGGSNRENSYFVFVFGCLAWSLWLIRNDLIFNNSIASSLDVCIFWIISFIQKWSILHKEKERLLIDSVTLKLKLQSSFFKLWWLKMEQEERHLFWSYSFFCFSVLKCLG